MRSKGPILALQAGADEHITKVENDAFEAALSAAGVEHEIVVYDGAPHSFFDRKQEQFAEASEDAWSRTLRFIERFGQRAHLVQGVRDGRTSSTSGRVSTDAPVVTKRSKGNVVEAPGGAGNPAKFRYTPPARGAP